MKNYEENIISTSFSLKDALKRFNTFTKKQDFTLFVVDENRILLGTVTDGDIRRGLINGVSLEDNITQIMFSGFKYILQNQYDFKLIDLLRQQEINLLPLLDESKKIIKILSLSQLKSLLPLEVVIMAGGKGERLRPLTIDTPKPLLKVGEKPILEHNIDRLARFGIVNMYITINYLGEKIIDYFGNGDKKALKIEYIQEKERLGTIGAVGLIEKFAFPHILVMNSDLLTDLDFEDFYKCFLEQDADMAIASIPYHVTLPYAVLETTDHQIKSFEEKPTYTYYSNAGIYLIKTEMIEKYIPYNQYFDATDLMQMLLDKGHKVVHFPIVGYWLDIGKHQDYQKAQDEISLLNWI